MQEFNQQSSHSDSQPRLVHQELHDYQNKGLIWYGCNSQAELKRVPSAFSELDNALQGGWPTQGIIELKTPLGIGEFRLVTPFLSYQQAQGKVVLVAPPFQINAEFLMANDIKPEQLLLLSTYQETEALWATEQCLSSGCCSTVVIWQEQLSIKQIRRFMLACEQGGATLIIMRHPYRTPALFSLPSTVSLTLKACGLGISVKVDKQKGGQATDFFVVNMSERWPELSITNTQVAPTHTNIVPFPKAVSQ